MNHPSAHAAIDPDKPAYIMATSGEVVTYGQLDERSARGARLFRQFGLVPGDHIALLMENHPRFFEIVWAAQRSGLIFTAIGAHLRADEVTYILDNCDAKLLVVSTDCSAVARAAIRANSKLKATFSVGERPSDIPSWDEAIASTSAAPIDDPCAGVHMLYSSGTTGSPKGVYPTWAPGRTIDHIEPGMAALSDAFGIGPDTIYLSPAPLYHAAPLIFNQLVMFQGGTSVIMEKFDAEAALSLMEHWRVTMAQFVPIMFIRMLKLAPEVRARFDLSSLKVAIHAAAPCPITVKQEMIDWWGPKLFEYYSSTENAGATLLSTPQWTSHQGSVGKPLGCAVHIIGVDGEELPTSTIGEVYFESPTLNFEYYKEPAQTAATRNTQGWASVGDIGYVDADGFLYLTDRKNFTIISGGVNIYPQEIENILISHPEVADIAVFGVPHPEFGQQVMAVVQPSRPDFDPEALTEELRAWSKTRMSPLKVPRRFGFDPALPRLDNGKLYKARIAAIYQETSSNG